MIVTKVNSAKAGSRSLKTTIPTEIVTILDLKPCDSIQWIYKDHRITIRKN